MVSWCFEYPTNRKSFAGIDTTTMSDSPEQRIIRVPYPLDFQPDQAADTVRQQTQGPLAGAPHEGTPQLREIAGDLYRAAAPQLGRVAGHASEHLGRFASQHPSAPSAEPRRQAPASTHDARIDRLRRRGTKCLATAAICFAGAAVSCGIGIDNLNEPEKPVMKPALISTGILIPTVTLAGLGALYKARAGARAGARAAANFMGTLRT